MFINDGGKNMYTTTPRSSIAKAIASSANQRLWEVTFYVLSFPIIFVLCWLLLYMVYICYGLTPAEVDQKSWQQKLPAFIVIFVIVYVATMALHLYAIGGD